MDLETEAIIKSLASIARSLEYIAGRIEDGLFDKK